MSKRANPGLVGAFVILGAILAVIALMLFGSGKLFKGTESYMMYFPNVNGLALGAPVKFKGVPVGQVTDIRIYNDRPKDEAIAVVVEVDDIYLNVKSNPGNLNIKSRADLEQEVRRGFSAKLEMISLLTGQLYIQLDYITDQEIVEQRLVKHARPNDLTATSPIKEIPTVRSGLDELQQNITELLADTGAVIGDLRIKLDELDFVTLNESLQSAVKGLDEIVNAPEIEEALGKIAPMMDEASALFTQLNSEVNPIALEIKNTLGSTQETLETLTKMVDEKSPLRYDLTTTLEDLSDAAKAMALLAEYLERNPNALLTGKAKDNDKKKK